MKGDYCFLEMTKTQNQIKKKMEGKHTSKREKRVASVKKNVND